MKQLLDDGINDYLAQRRSMQLATGTVKNEASVLRRFLTSVGNIWIHNIREHHVMRHFEVAGATRAPVSLRLDYIYLGQFFDWARRTRRMPVGQDPMAGRRPPRVTKRERQRIPVTGFDHLLEVAGTVSPRNRAAVAVMLYTLARDQEAARLKVGDVQLDAGYLKMTITKSYTEDLKPISAELDTELRTWLTVYQAECGPLHPDWYLFPRRTLAHRGPDCERPGGALSPLDYVYGPTMKMKTMSTIVRPALVKYGWNMEGTGEGCHTLRRSGARALFDSLSADGHDFALRIVQAMLNHKSVTTTEVYIGVSADRRTRDDVIRGRVMYNHERPARLRVAQ